MTPTDFFSYFLFFLLGLLTGALLTRIAYRFGERKAKRLLPMRLLSGLLFGLAYWMHKDAWPELVLSLLLISLCLLVSLTDLLYMRIPNMVLLLFFPLILLLRAVSHPESFSSYLLGGVAGVLIFLLPALLRPSAVGMGDVKLMGTLGLAMGWQPLLICLFLSSFFAFLSAVVLLLAKKAKKNDSLPFAPWLSAGAVLAHFWSDQLFSAYWLLLGRE